MSLRLALLTEIIAPYRIPVFNALAKIPGIDLHVIFLAETDPSQRQWHVYKEEIQFSYEVLPSWRKWIAGRMLLLNRGLGKALNRFAPEAIVCGGYNYLASWQALQWARRNRRRFYVWIESTVRDQRGGTLFVKFLKTSFLRRCEGVIVPGTSSFQYARHLGVSGERIFTAPNAVDTDLFARHAAAARENAMAFRQKFSLPSRYFLYVGRLIPDKGVFDLLNAYSKLDQQIRKEVGLVFAGNGISHDELVRQARAIMPGQIQFPGFAHREDLAAIYGLADVLVFPTYSDTWGLVVNEALACSLPVVLTNVAGCAADLVTDHWNGLVVTPRNVPQLVSAMEEMATGEAMRSVMREHSWERIQHYSPEQCAAGIASAVLADHGHTRGASACE